jgi:hypothetical protein
MVALWAHHSRWIACVSCARGVHTPAATSTQTRTCLCISAVVHLCMQKYGVLGVLGSSGPPSHARVHPRTSIYKHTNLEMLACISHTDAHNATCSQPQYVCAHIFMHNAYDCVYLDTITTHTHTHTHTRTRTNTHANCGYITATRVSERYCMKHTYSQSHMQRPRTI